MCRSLTNQEAVSPKASSDPLSSLASPEMFSDLNTQMMSATSYVYTGHTDSREDPTAMAQVANTHGAALGAYAGTVVDPTQMQRLSAHYRSQTPSRATYISSKQYGSPTYILSKQYGSPDQYGSHVQYQSSDEYRNGSPFQDVSPSQYGSPDVYGAGTEGGRGYLDVSRSYINGRRTRGGWSVPDQPHVSMGRSFLLEQVLVGLPVGAGSTPTYR